ncbi:MAG TPA: hypothetical protein VHB70_19670 [Parafilimonas sp.]|nr:hypothetical protein [Parafilimonas sp.]
MKYKLAIFIVLFSLSLTAFSQDNGNNNNDDDTAYQLSTVDGIIHALYDVISGPVGQERDWAAFRNLFAENAHMYIAVPDKDSGSILKSITPEEYSDRNQTRLSDIGFTENELYRITNTYGAGTQVFSTYESHYTDKNGVEDITKGINNIQLFFDGDRYFIVSIFWDANAKNIEVPDRYLPKDKHTEYQINL